MNGITAVFSRSNYRIGWDIYLRKNEDGKLWQPSSIDIHWEQCFEMDRIKEFLSVREIESYDSPNKQSALYGENEALKNEVKFLREQINMMLKIKA